MKNFTNKRYYSVVVSTSPRAMSPIPFFEKQVGDVISVTAVATRKKDEKVIIYVSTGKMQDGGIYGLGTIVSDRYSDSNTSKKLIDIQLDYVCTEENPLLTYDEICPSILGQVVRPQYIRHEIPTVEKLFADKGLI